MILTAIGPDRPGIVKTISRVIHQAGANLEDSRMAILAKEFALLVLFSGTTESIEKIREGCGALEKELNFSIHFKTTDPVEQPAKKNLFTLDVTGVDQTGIVYRVSDVLANHSVNVISLESRLTRAAFSGTPVFKLQAEFELEHQDLLENIKHQLESVCEELNLTYTLIQVEA